MSVTNLYNFNDMSIKEQHNDKPISVLTKQKSNYALKEIRFPEFYLF